ncbi:MAG: non-hydrolyzing UDP-N-acetylglucosamine 2-epimerase [Limnothrix sp. BL-A-16]
MRICVTIGTRPEAIKMAPVARAFLQDDRFETQILLTGQHKEMVEQVMSLFELQGDRDLAIMQPGQTLTDITCRSLTGLGALFAELQPQLVLVQGDTTTAFAAALAAFYQQIPVGHVEAGLRTDNLYSPFPEEANRRLISQVTQLHFAPTDLAVANLQKSGVMGEVHQTGNTVIDALLAVAAKNPPCPIAPLAGTATAGRSLDWSAGPVILATVHRRENWGDPLHEIADGFLGLLDRFPDLSLVLPLHRNPTVREPLIGKLGPHDRVFLTEPLDYSALIGAMQRSTLILTDSGGLQEEAPSLGKPVLVLRDTTERPEAIAAGTAKLIGTATADIVREASLLLSDRAAYEAMAHAANPFGDGQAAARIVQAVAAWLAQRSS